jgi:DNA invertase Pin-like site-specific DNA recombinase
MRVCENISERYSGNWLSRRKAGLKKAIRRAWERNGKTNMQSQAQRSAILELSGKGVSHREIARVMQLSRVTVRKVLSSNSTQVPEIHRAEKAEPYRQQILDLLASCHELAAR